MYLSRGFQTTAMRATPSLFLLLFTVAFAQRPVPLAAQQLPADARPWQLVRTLIQEIGAPGKNVDREAFRSRLTGEAALEDVEELRGRWQAYTDVNIDSIIVLPSTFRQIPANPKAQLPPRTDTIERSLVYATTYVNGLYDNCYFFCERDSIWRIESWRQFPSPAQRTAIIAHVNNPDTALSGSFAARIHLSRLLLNDADLGLLFKDIADDTEKIIPQLSRSAIWDRLDLAGIAFDSIDEYDGLQDNLDPVNRLFYRLNLSALQRLQEFGIAQILRVRGNIDTTEIILLELPSALGYSAGFAYAAAPQHLPSPTKDAFFALKPLTPNWWLFKRKEEEPGQTLRTLGPGTERSAPKQGKASYLVPKQNES